MSRHSRYWMLPAVCALVLAGCGQPTGRLNAPPQGDAEHRSELQPFFTCQVDNAMMADMTISDIHFVPHTAELNSLGTARLTRMAKVIDAYGGTVRYATREPSEDLVNQRLAHVREYLTTSGVDAGRVDARVAQAGSNFTGAAEAIEATDKGMASTFGSFESSGEDEGEGQ